MKECMGGSDWRVMEFLNKCVDEHLGSPSMQEIAEAVGVSRARVTLIVDWLEMKGYVTWRIAGRRRSPRGLLAVLEIDEVKRLDQQARTYYDARKQARDNEAARKRMAALRGRRTAQMFEVGRSAVSPHLTDLDLQS